MLCVRIPLSFYLFTMVKINFVEQDKHILFNISVYPFMNLFRSQFFQIDIQSLDHDVDCRNGDLFQAGKIIDF